jgi:hypothetical protein
MVKRLPGKALPLDHILLQKYASIPSLGPDDFVKIFDGSIQLCKQNRNSARPAISSFPA